MFNNSKYTKWYYSIITNAKSRSIQGYFEEHHIIPKSLGGNNNADNLVKLTAKEHYIVHLLLPYMVVDSTMRQKMWAALRCMSDLKSPTHKRHVGYAKLYEKAKQNIDFGIGNRGRKQTAEEVKKRSDALKGHPCSDETKRKIGEANRGRKLQPRSEETRMKLAEASRGRVLSVESRAKLSESSKKRGHNGFVGKGSRGPASAESWTKYHATIENRRQAGIKVKPREQVTCPHCNKTGNISGMKRYHFDKCKSIIASS